MQLFYDESGNTGLDLLSQEQPYFCLASTSLSEDICRQLIRPLLRVEQSEVKYSKLKSSPRGRELLIDFFESPHIAIDTCKSQITNKVMYLVSHIVDKVLEPVLHRDGIDMYKDDMHVGIANLLYFGGEYLFPGHWKKIQQAFLKAIRERSRSSYHDYELLLKKACKRSGRNDDPIITMFMLSHDDLEDALSGLSEMNAFDPAVDSFTGLTQDWMMQISGNFDVIHDISKPMRRNEAFLRFLSEPGEPSIIGYGDRQAELPLRMNSLVFADSKLHPGLQVADLLAGASVDLMMVLSGRKGGLEYHERLNETPLLKLGGRGILPDKDALTRKNPSLEGEVSLVDGTLAFLEKRGYFSESQL